MLNVLRSLKDSLAVFALMIYTGITIPDDHGQEEAGSD